MQHAAAQPGLFAEAEVWCGNPLIGATPPDLKVPPQSAGQATSTVSVRVRLLDELRHQLKLNQYSIRLEWAAPIL